MDHATRTRIKQQIVSHEEEIARLKKQLDLGYEDLEWGGETLRFSQHEYSHSCLNVDMKSEFIGSAERGFRRFTACGSTLFELQRIINDFVAKHHSDIKKDAEQEGNY